MLCPYCNQAMTEGYVQSARVMFFTTAPKELFLTPGKDGVTLSKTTGPVPMPRPGIAEPAAR